MTTHNETFSQPQVLYGAAAIADYLGVTRRQAFHMIEAKGLPTFKMGRTVCARPGVVRGWLTAKERAGSVDA